jgi:hypothetical protein
MGLKDLLTNPPQNFKYYVGGQGYTGNGSTPSMLNLRYGNDTLGGGDSNQPYIQTSIPTGFNGLQNSTSDFILRGGMLAAKDSVTDVRRLGKMFKDTKSPNGLLFIAKQQVLSRVAVRTQASTGLLNEGTYTPLSTLAEAGLVAFGGHLNKQGLNPFIGGGNQQFFRGSYLKALQPTTFATNSESNKYDRLVQLFGIKLVSTTNTINAFRNFPYTENISATDTPNILSYTGGPGSILGVGKTYIKYALNNSGGYLTTKYDNLNLNPKNGTANYMTTNFSGFVSLFVEKNTGNTADSINNTTISNAEVRVKTKKYDFNNNDRNVAGYTPFIGYDFRQSLIQILDPNFNPQTTILSNSPNYPTENLEQRTNIGGKSGFGPGNNTGKNLISYTSGSRIGPIDKINALPIYLSNTVDTSQPINDLVKFRIAAIDAESPNYKNFIHFRAFLDSFSDTYNADWGTVNYLGRGENFYTYKGFNRTISMGWTVAAQSKEEIMIMYKKLNYLASNLAPSYTSKGYMAGNLVQLTVGGYLYEQVGFITGLTYDVPTESPWEIGINDEGGYDPSVKEVPHIIKVTGFNFTPIQEFIPSKQDLLGYERRNNTTFVATKYGDQRFIALANGTDATNNNYDTPDPYKLGIK